MRKISIIATIIAILAISGYSAAWYFGAHKVESALADYVQAYNQKKEQGEVSYSSIKTTGFPGIFHITVNNPTLTKKDGESEASLKTEKFLITLDWLHSAYSVMVPDNIIYEHAQGDKKESREVKYDGIPTLTVQLKSFSSWKKILKSDDLIDDINEVNYADQGFNVVNPENGAIPFKAKPIKFNMKVTQPDEGKKIRLDIKFGLEGFETDLPAATDLWKFPDKLTAVGDISFIATIENANEKSPLLPDWINNYSQIDTVVTQFDVSSGAMAISLHGMVNASKSRLMPTGQVYIEAKQVPALLEYLHSIGLVKDIAGVQNILQKITEEPTDTENMDFVIKSVNPIGIHVGTLEILQIISLFKKL